MMGCLVNWNVPGTHTLANKYMADTHRESYALSLFLSLSSLYMYVCLCIGERLLTAKYLAPETRRLDYFFSRPLLLFFSF